ncbi:MAG: MBOAT family O-acyltransferase [Eubacteriales bacterium]|nr:MBOAT family O-acyltransferase [Eubacteriales bacterium]
MGIRFSRRPSREGASSKDFRGQEQIYCDFAGYSIIAMGSAKMLGIELMENFDTPFLSRTVSEFWRRWHISLSSWFRDYLYIPLGGSRRGKVRKVLNTLITFAVSGLWHGADWGFVVWGLINGIYQVVGSALRPAREKLDRALCLDTDSSGYHLWKRLFIFVCFALSMVFFRARTVRTAVSMLRSMLYIKPGHLFSDPFFGTIDGPNAVVLILGLLVLLFADCLKYRGVKIRGVLMRQDWLFQAVFLSVSVTAEKEFSDDAASNLRYLRLFEEECRKRGIRLVLITLPFSASEKDAMIANAVADFAAGLDVPYLNLLEGTPVDYRCDFADRDAHLNISGACKVSAFLADYLSESCGLPDHRGDSGFDDWDADYASWIGTMDARVKEQNYLKHTLMLLSHPRYMPVIYISPGSALFGDSHIQALLRSLCGGSELPGFAEAAAAEKSYLLFYDRNAGKRYEAVGSTSIPDTPYGEILVLPENGLVRLGGTESTLAVVSGNAASGELQCYVFTADMTPLPACSHSFGPGDGGEYYRNDYPD